MKNRTEPSVFQFSEELTLNATVLEQVGRLALKSSFRCEVTKEENYHTLSNNYPGPIKFDIPYRIFFIALQDNS